MIYRRDKSANPKFVNMHSKDVSKVISNMWKNESDEVKMLFEALARKSVEIYSELYHDYKYKLKYKLKSKNFFVYKFKLKKDIDKMSIKFILN